MESVGALVLRCVAAGPSEGGGWPGARRGVQAVGVTVVTPGGHASLDPTLALSRHLLGTRSVMVTPSPQPHDPHKEFAAVARASRLPGGPAGRRRVRGPPAPPRTP